MKKRSDRLWHKYFTFYNLGWLVVILIYNMAIYEGARILTQKRHHFCLHFCMDDRIPFLPWTIVIYWGCFTFWAAAYIVILGCGKTSARSFAIKEMLGKTICFFIYVAMPTTMERPCIGGNSIWFDMVRLLYKVDAPDNLFPSIHCYISWLCFLGVRDKESIPVWFKVVSIVMAVSVCVSTLTLKQHVVVDVFAGILVAEIVWHLQEPI